MIPRLCAADTGSVGFDAERGEFAEHDVLVDAVDFVDDEDQGLSRAAQAIDDVAIGRQQAVARIDDEQDRIGLGDRDVDLGGRLCGKALGVVHQPAGVDDDERLARVLATDAVVPIARDAGQIGDERVARARQHVEQRRFADVRPTDEGDYGEHDGSRVLDRAYGRRNAQIPSPACGRGLG